MIRARSSRRSRLARTRSVAAYGCSACCQPIQPQRHRHQRARRPSPSTNVARQRTFKPRRVSQRWRIRDNRHLHDAARCRYWRPGHSRFRLARHDHGPLRKGLGQLASNGGRLRKSNARGKHSPSECKLAGLASRSKSLDLSARTTAPNARTFPRSAVNILAASLCSSVRRLGLSFKANKGLMAFVRGKIRRHRP